MKKINNKKFIVVILITLVLVLAVSAQPTLASLPGQTVPTVKPTGHKTSDGSNNGTASSTSTPANTPGSFITSTQTPIFNGTINSNASSTNTPAYAPGSFITSTPTPTLTSQAVEMTVGNTLAALTSTNTASQEFLETSVTPEYTLTPVTKLIPVVLSSNPALNPYLFCVYAIIILGILLFIFFLIRRRRPAKTPDENEPKPE